jgi:hypothetical protein
MTITQPIERINRVSSDWSKAAQEDITVEFRNGFFTAVCSEIAALRLYHYYRGNDKARVIYSDNLQSWVFSLETDL